MPGVTISAGYGAVGSVIAPRVAARLDLPLLDRAISSDIAARLHVTVREAESGAAHRSLVARFLGVLAPLAGGVLGAGTDAAPAEAFPLPDEAALFRRQAETIMNAALASGAVILGRGGAAAFRNRPDVLRVRLFGAVDARVAQACRVESVDTPTARERLDEVDRARAQYVRRLYGTDIDDPALFDLQIDSTRITANTCVDLIVAAYLALPAPDAGRSEIRT